MKKKGVPDPYAYIPLNRQMLNRRKKVKLSGQFSHMVGRASAKVPRNTERKKVNFKKNKQIDNIDFSLRKMDIQ